MAGVTYVDATRTTTGASLNAASTSIQVGSAAGFNVGDEILVISMQGNGAPGAHTFARVSGVAGDTLNLTNALGQAFNGAADTVVVQRVPHYTDVTIQNGGVLTASAWDGSGGGIVAFRANGAVDVQLGGAISADGLGFRGGAGVTQENPGIQGESHFGLGAPGNQTPNGGGGGGGLREGASADVGGGGGGAGHFLAGLPGQDSFNGSPAIDSRGFAGNPYATSGSLFLGAGGGSGAHDSDSAANLTLPSGYGGAGGGIVWFTANQLNAAGTISASGAVGGNDQTGNNSETGGGGGGAGGSVFIQSYSNVNAWNTLFGGGVGGKTFNNVVDGVSQYKLDGGVGGHGYININGVGLTPVDFRTGQADVLDAVSGFAAPNWAPSSDGSSIQELTNSQPTVWHLPGDILNHRIIGTITPGGDDDIIGLVLGFNPGDATNGDAEFLLLDWKRTTQSYNFSGGNADLTDGSTAELGLALSRVSGIVSADELWGHFDDPGTSGGVEELARAMTLGDVGYSTTESYLFEILYGEERVQIYVNGALEFDLEGSFGEGLLGMYELSQHHATNQASFSDFYTMPLNIAAIPEPSDLGLWFALSGAVAVACRCGGVRVAPRRFTQAMRHRR